MKNNKKIIIGIIALALFAVLAIFISFNSSKKEINKESLVPMINAIGKGSITGTITGKYFNGTTAVFLYPLQNISATSSAINIPFVTMDDATINVYQPIDLNGGDYFDLYVVNAAGTSTPFYVSFSNKTYDNHVSNLDEANAWFYGSVATSTFNISSDFVIDSSIEEEYCPIAQMSHVYQIPCMEKVLSQKEKVADALSKSISSQMAHLYKPYENSGDDGFMNKGIAYEDLMSSLPDLNKSFKPYRDALCATEVAEVTGNGWNDEYISCQIQETEKYTTRLQDLKAQWIN